MMKGTLKGILDLLKKMLNCRINDINFEKDKSYAVEQTEVYCVKMLNLINGLFQDYYMELIDLDSVIEVDLKEFTYEVI
jgi:hypothetical protein